MFKKTLSLILAIITLISVFSITAFTASAEENKVFSATDDEASVDEATADEEKLVISDVPKSDSDNIDGLVIGYIGDVNKDDKINVKDATYLQKSLAKIVYLTESAKLLADADNNGKLNVRDATTIQKHIAGFSVESKVWYLLYITGKHAHHLTETIVEQTCERDGCTLISCICGYEYADNITEAKGHSYTTKISYATCIDSAYTVYTCQNCDHWYRKELSPPTGDHEYDKGKCKVCGYRASTPYFEELKDFLIKNGEYMSEIKCYVYNLDTGYEADYSAVLYSVEDDMIGFSYTLVYEGGYVDVVTVSISAEDDNFYYYMTCQDAFECAGSYSVRLYSENVLNITNSEYYFYDNEIKEVDARDYTLSFIDAALLVYRRNEDHLPVTLKKLGFTNFDLK